VRVDITRDGQDMNSRRCKWVVATVGWSAHLVRVVDPNNQVEAYRRVFASNTRWTVVGGSDFEEGESQGQPARSRHVGVPILEGNIKRGVDFALFMAETLENDALGHAGG